MTDRDWEKELAKIDRQLASISDEELSRPSAPPAGGAGVPPPSRAAVTAPAARVPLTAAPAGASSGKAKAWAWTKVTLAATAAVGLWVWPFPARCGPPLIGLVAAAGATALLSLWSARGTWRHRLGVGHVLSLVAFASALVLGAREVLPRVGYAMPTFDRPATWSCQADAPATTPSPSPGPGAATGGPSATTL
ncbi:MAG TPA: hypothetical protein PKE51_01910 [Gemmatimonadaceae bacterium]|nr:hypothetical protein [Gemmatimonadaceae bacterium]